MRQEDREAVITALQGLHCDDEFHGCIDVLLALPTISAQFGGGTVLDPQCLEQYPTMPVAGRKRTLRNSAVMFAGSQSKYTGRLIRELKYIRSNASDEELERTALAYVFREEPLSASPPDEQSMPFPFVDMNSEQRQAVSVAINMPVSRITGPPGTGKSQVAVNIICNLLLRRRSVLFTSMNHKAVNAISSRIGAVEEAMSQSLPHHDRLPLVTFCKSADGLGMRQPWNRQDVDAIAGELEAMQSQQGRISCGIVERAEECWRAIEQQSSDRESLKERYAAAECQCEMLVDELRHLHPAGNADDMKTPLPTHEESRTWHDVAEKLGDEPPFTWSWRWLKWRILECRGQRRARRYMADHFPEFCRGFTSVAKMRGAFAKYLDVADRCRGYLQQLEQLESAIHRLPNDNDTIARLEKCMGDIQENQIAALSQNLVDNASVLSAEPQARVRLREAMAVLEKSSSESIFRDRRAETLSRAKQLAPGLARLCPAWAVTMLSLQHAAPCIAGYYDHVIIDEASQCLVPPMIPALFRAKALTVIGDPKQFPPVINMLPLRHGYIAARHQINTLEDMSFSFMGRTAYSILSCASVMLREHFRCAYQIAQYCNQEFYRSELIICSDEEQLRRLRPQDVRNAIDWHACRSRDEEINEVCKCVDSLCGNGYPGTIGVLTILRDDANEIEERLNDAIVRLGGDRLLVNTANGFQGGERDVIFLVLGYHANLSPGQRWYFEADEHRYIYNVAVSRAKACLVVIGDRDYCRSCHVHALRTLAALPRESPGWRLAGANEPSRQPGTLQFDSIWEQRLYYALEDAGIATQPQYRLAGRRLDLAYVSDRVKIDIEVDGVKYHASPTGGRKLDDYFRDMQVTNRGWKVIRFWVQALKEDMPGCVKKVEEMIVAG